MVPAPGRRRGPGQSISEAVVAAVSAVVLAVGGVTAYVIVRHHPSTPAAAPGRSPSATASKPTSTASASASHSATSSPTPTPTPTTNAKITATGWDDTTVHAVAKPVAIANVVVAYTADDGKLTLRAIDPASGATLWSHPATTAQSTPGQQFDVASLDNTVFYYVSVGDPLAGEAEIAAIDATTGAQKWLTNQAVAYADMPSLCSDKAALCDSAYTSEDASQEIRTDVATGAQSLLSSTTSRNLGTGIWDAGDRKPEHIEHLNEVTGRVVWKDDVVQLFGETVSSDNGWDFSTFGDVYVGWLGTPSTGSGDSHTITFHGDETVGIRAVDGVRLWRRPGLFGCPAQGLADDAQPFAVRCLVSGTVTLDAAYENVVASHVNVTVQGFDVHTGATTWSARLGNTPAALGLGEDSIVRISADVFSLNDFAGRTTAINLRTGAVSTPTADTVGWCVQSGFYTIDGINQDDGTPLDFFASGLTTPCNPNGAHAAPADGTATGYGATVGGYFVWASKDGLHAFAIGDGG